VRRSSRKNVDLCGGEEPLPATVSGPLFDHLVGAQQGRRGHLKTERFGGLEIEDRFEFVDLFDWYVAGFRPLENLATK
jgi:hypothetical protein